MKNLYVSFISDCVLPSSLLPHPSEKHFTKFIQFINKIKDDFSAVYYTNNRKLMINLVLHLLFSDMVH